MSYSDKKQSSTEQCSVNLIFTLTCSLHKLLRLLKRGALSTEEEAQPKIKKP